MVRELNLARPLRTPSVVVDEFDLLRMPFGPYEAQPPWAGGQCGITQGPAISPTSSRTTRELQMHGLLNRRDALMGLGLCGLGSMATASPTEGTVYRGFKGTQVRFAAVEVGQAILGTNDAWISSTSDFQRTAIMHKPGPICCRTSSSGTGNRYNPGATTSALVGSAP